MAYINREKLIKKFEKLKEKAGTLRDTIYLDGVLAVIECEPTADVAEVVICKECKWWIGERCLNPNGAYNCVTGPYWFCKSGQRREKENASNTEC